MLNFLYIVNPNENLCSSYYFQYVSKNERTALESDVVKRCMACAESKCSFLEYKEFKIIYRRYNTLLFITGTDKEENELSVYEFIQLFVEVLDKYFDGVNEQHLHMHQDKVRVILQEMVVNGYIVETNISNVLTLLQMVDQHGSNKK